MKNIFLLIFTSLSITSSFSQTKKFILNEEFNSNKLGWTEEYTNSHVTEIKDGYLFINSIDTSKYQSSNGPLRASFLLDLPKKYTIEAILIPIELKPKQLFGILLNSASLNYRFYISSSGTAGVWEYDTNRDSEIIVSNNSENKTKISSGDLINFKIQIDERNFEFYINDKLCAQGILNSKSWADLRLFTTTGSSIKIDYIRIY